MISSDNTWAIEINDLTVAYKYRPVLWDIDLRIPKGKMVVILGPNGAGKSTLIKTILGVVKPLAGTIRIFGNDVDKVRSLIGYVPQRSSVDWDFPATVLDVVLMGTYGKLGWIRRPGKKEKRLAQETIEKLGLSEMAHRQISQLSGGQQQRVFLARALVQNSEIYFLDEPFQGIDAATEQSIIEILRELQNKQKTIVVVHHDLQTVTTYFNYAVFINVRKIADGPIPDVFTRENLEKTYGMISSQTGLPDLHTL